MARTFKITLLPISCKTFHNIIKLCECILKAIFFIVAFVVFAVIHVIFYYSATLNEFVRINREFYGDFVTSVCGTVGLAAMIILDIIIVCVILGINFDIRWCRK